MHGGQIYTKAYQWRGRKKWDLRGLPMGSHIYDLCGMYMGVYSIPSTF